MGAFQPFSDSICLMFGIGHGVFEVAIESRIGKTD
jgi:hypothetical protein